MIKQANKLSWQISTLIQIQTIARDVEHAVKNTYTVNEGVSRLHF